MNRRDFAEHIDRVWPRLPMDLREHLIQFAGQVDELHIQSLQNPLDHSWDIRISDVARSFMTNVIRSKPNNIKRLQLVPKHNENSG